MFILYPKPDEYLVCARCERPIQDSSEFGEDGAMEDYWCDHCVDVVDVRAVKK